MNGYQNLIALLEDGPGIAGFANLDNALTAAAEVADDMGEPGRKWLEDAMAYLAAKVAS